MLHPGAACRAAQGGHSSRCLELADGSVVPSVDAHAEHADRHYDPVLHTGKGSQTRLLASLAAAPDWAATLGQVAPRSVVVARKRLSRHPGCGPPTLFSERRAATRRRASMGLATTQALTRPFKAPPQLEPMALAGSVTTTTHSIASSLRRQEGELARQAEVAAQAPRARPLPHCQLELPPAGSSRWRIAHWKSPGSQEWGASSAGGS